MRIARVVIPLLLAGAAIVAFRLNSTAEPRVTGKSLTEWLAQYAYTGLNETQRLEQASNAVLMLPPSRVLPHLHRLVTAEDGPIRRWLMEKNEKLKWSWLRWRDAGDREVLGLVGYQLLQTNAAPAVESLAALLEDPKHALTAARCLEAIGTPAEGALCRCLTNRIPAVRSFAIGALAGVTPDVEVYVARIRGGLQDPEPEVRGAVVAALAAQNEAPELAIPLLLTAMRDTNDLVSSQAITAFGGFGTNAMGVFPMLSNLAVSGNNPSANAALSVLPAISATAALPILSNAVVHGEDNRLATALNLLKKMAPELALKMDLAELHGTNATRRYQAITVLGGFDLETAGVVDELKVASKDPDPEVVQRATEALERMAQTQRQRRREKGDPREFPGEPAYEGRSLGVWLKLVAEPETATNATIALRHMGTNIVPALLARLVYCDRGFDYYDSEVGLSAAFGFMALTEQQARPALPALGELMDGQDEEVVSLAMLATYGTGSNAFPFFVKGLNSRFPDVRSQAASIVYGEWGAQYREQQRATIPLLWTLLNDPDQNVRSTAKDAIKDLDPKGAARAGIK